MEVKVKDINQLSVLHMVMEALYNKLMEVKVKDNLLPPLNNIIEDRSFIFLD